jgi:hypothetical protein
MKLVDEIVRDEKKVEMLVEHEILQGKIVSVKCLSFIKVEHEKRYRYMLEDEIRLDEFLEIFVCDMAHDGIRNVYLGNVPVALDKVEHLKKANSISKLEGKEEAPDHLLKLSNRIKGNFFCSEQPSHRFDLHTVLGNRR